MKKDFPNINPYPTLLYPPKMSVLSLRFVLYFVIRNLFIYFVVNLINVKLIRESALDKTFCLLAQSLNHHFQHLMDISWFAIFVICVLYCIYGSEINYSILGPSLLSKIGKALKSKFWEQVLQSTIKMSEGITFCNPENLLFSSFWYNPFIRRNNKVISYDVSPELQTKTRKIQYY